MNLKIQFNYGVSNCELANIAFKLHIHLVQEKPLKVSSKAALQLEKLNLLYILSHALGYPVIANRIYQRQFDLNIYAL